MPFIQQLRGISGKIRPLNCAAFEDSLLQADLFGYKKGAFTGAEKDKEGLIEEAQGGTLFLDEIADLSLDCQSKLLRLLQSGEYRRMGDTQDRRFKGRVIGATNKDLEALMAEKKFRQDLYDRLNGWIIHLPPLRQRKEEILPLTEYFLHLYGQERNYVLTKGAERYLLNLEHKANVRGLQRTVERAIQIAISQSTNVIKESFLLEDGLSQRPIDEIDPFYLHMTKREKEYLIELLKACDGNRGLAIEVSELSRSSFFNVLQKHGIRKTEG